MANIYYCHSETHGSGVLRAVLSSDEGRTVLKGHHAQYSGLQFPATVLDMEPDFAVLRLFEGERSEEWLAGFYRFDESIMRIEQTVKACDAGHS